MLAKLTKQGLKMAILSNKSHDFTLEMVAHLLGGFQFETVQGAIPGQPIKPDPAGALKIANRLALTPAEFIYLGDMAVDMKTARASGMVPVRMAVSSARPWRSP